MKILVADDDRIMRRLLETYLLKWGHEPTGCSDGAEAWERLQEDRDVKMAILDWMMPGMDGPEICRKARSVRRLQYVYIILLTSRQEKCDIVMGLEAGADDYMVKPFDPNELNVRVRTGVRIVRLQDELIAALQESEFRASHDPLTGMLNRGAILEVLRSELSRSEREGTPVGLIIADIDHFKQINDRFGHLAGDAVLREVARKLRNALRPYDSVGRYGGEEFLIVVPGCGVSQTAGLAERVRSIFSGAPISTSEGILPITLSFGVAVGHSGACTADELIRSADDALYRAKENGRDRVESSRGHETVLLGMRGWQEFQPAASAREV